MAGTGLGGNASGYPPVDDLDAWRAFVDAANEMVAAMFDAENAEHQSTVEARVVGDVDVYVVTPAGFPDDDDQPIWAGTRDLFLSNAVRMHRKLRAAGVDAELHVFEAMPHGGFFGAPEDREIDAEVQRFVAAHVAP